MKPFVFGLALVRRIIVIAAAFFFFPFAFANVPVGLKPVGVGLGSATGYSSGPYANTMLTGFGWLEYAPSTWGTGVAFINTDDTPNPQFNARGLPKYLNAGKSLRMTLWPYGVNGTSWPAGWPVRGGTGVGKWVVTWTGNADIRMNSAPGVTFVAAESSGASTGALLNGRRVYQMTATNPLGHIIVVAVNTEVTDLKVWLPDPADPQNQSLENSGQFWHPQFLSTLNEMDFAFLRFMDWGATNASPDMNWSERRPPDFAVQGGTLNRRSPAPGVAGITGNRETGVAYEHMVALANAANKDMWICVPHLATDAFVTNLANLIRYGSDGTNPYTSTQANPVYPPLNTNLKVWVEFSNEIWQTSSGFAQGHWAQAQADALGVSRPVFTARRFAQVWRIFQQQFGGSTRIVRPATIFTAGDSYTLPFLTELKNYGATLTPAVSVDVVSPTTYFGNGIQGWVYEQANLNRGTADQWFHTAADFIYNTTTGATRPVSVPLNNTQPYWTSPEFAAQQAATFAEWRKRLFSGSSAQGGGPDSTGTGGGFSETLRDNIYTIFGQRIPIVSYEGGPSLYTDSLDGGDAQDNGLTDFISALNRAPEFADIYRIQLNMARSKGLATHGMFVDVSSYGKYGQWGHREYTGQPFNEAIKWAAVADWVDDMADIRNIDDQVGARPSFVTPGTLPMGQSNSAYSQEVEVTGGDYVGAGTPHLVVIGSQLSPGLALAPVSGNPSRYRVSGTPLDGGWNYFYLRVSDDDGDAAWQVYSFYVTGGPNVLVESDLRGAFTGASSLPKTTTYTVAPTITWSGLDRGAVYAAGGGSATGSDGRGVSVFADTNAIRFSVSQGTASQTPSTLASAITDNEYWKFTFTPQVGSPLNLRKAEFHLTWCRAQYHAPRKLAVMSSVGGFTEGNQVYTLAGTPAADQVSDVIFRLPDTSAYENLTSPVEFRVYFYGSQYSHYAQLLGLKVSRDPATAPPEPSYHLTLDSDFTGTNPGLSLPWTQTSTLESGLIYSGWTKGAGVISQGKGVVGVAGNNALHFYQNMPAAEASSTLAQALLDNEYVGFTIQRPTGTMDLRVADISFVIRRVGGHSPRRYAVFTSVDGFTTGSEVFDTGRFTALTSQTFSFQLPDDPAYQGVSGPVDVRIYGYSGQYSGHVTSLEDFSLSLFE